MVRVCGCMYDYLYLSLSLPPPPKQVWHWWDSDWRDAFCSSLGLHSRCRGLTYLRANSHKRTKTHTNSCTPHDCTCTTSAFSTTQNFFLPLLHTDIAPPGILSWFGSMRRATTATVCIDWLLLVFSRFVQHNLQSHELCVTFARAILVVKRGWMNRLHYNPMNKILLFFGYAEISSSFESMWIIHF